MEHQWWDITGVCPKCGKKMRVIGVFYCANDQLKFVAVCDKDKLLIKWVSYISDLRETTRDKDLELFLQGQEPRPPKQGKKQKFRGPVKPPLAPSPRVPETLNSGDEIFLRDIGIEPGNGGRQ